MAMLKCKMCGGNLEVSEGTTVCECEYCGTTQTVPKAQDDVTANLFNRANNLRIKCEFDKAQEIYEKIVSANPNESEAYWGIVLCKFGIEYVEDPATFKKIPTCHRTQLESVQTDVDYRAAIENADSIQRSLYEREAAEIDRLQRDILAIVHNEDPFDVFICYKETDENGKRTNDSVIANDIYHQLTQEGFKVFYAAITLEDKLGQAYEPYIFAALTSAKVMLVIGSKPEYFNAVWVKNEWSRYLKIMKNDRSKLLIPCYKDMDAYDLPDEFAHLQAQDMSKIGFINDVIRGIKKVIVKDEPKPVASEKVVERVVESAGNSNIVPLLKRCKIFLEDGDWNSADDYCEKVLDIDPECAHAYLYKLMANWEIHSEDEFEQRSVKDISKSAKFLCNQPEYKKAYKFGDDELKKQLSDYNDVMLYNCLVKRMNDCKNDDDFRTLKNDFGIIQNFRDSAEKAAQCEENAQNYIYNIAKSIMNNAKDSETYLKAAEKFKTVIDYMDSKEKIELCNEKSKEYYYNIAMQKMDNAENDADYLEAAEIFETVMDFKDSREKIELCKEKSKEYIYNSATQMMNNAARSEAYLDAAEKFQKIIDYKDSKEKIELCKEKSNDYIYNKAEKLMSSNTFEDVSQSLELFKSISFWKDSENRIDEAKQKLIEYNKIESKYKKAISKFEQVSKMTYYDEKVLVDLAIEFHSLNNYKKSNEYKQECANTIIAQYHLVKTGNIEGVLPILFPLGCIILTVIFVMRNVTVYDGMRLRLWFFATISTIVGVLGFIGVGDNFSFPQIKKLRALKAYIQKLKDSGIL